MSEYLDLISIDPFSIIVTICNLLILFLIIKKFLFKPVQKVLSQRQQEVDKIYDDAEKAQSAAQKDKKEYSEKLSGVNLEAEKIIKQATDKANRMSESIISEADETAAQKLRKADEDIAQERKKAVNEIKDEISTISVEIAQKVVEREINEKDHEKLIDSFIDSIGEQDG